MEQTKLLSAIFAEGGYEGGLHVSTGGTGDYPWDFICSNLLLILLTVTECLTSQVLCQTKLFLHFPLD